MVKIAQRQSRAWSSWVCLGLAAGACASPSVMLKTPIANECTATGLKGCPEIAEGMLLYVEGDRPRAVEKLAQGAGQNSPDRLQKFAEALAALRAVPGAETYLGSVGEAVGVLVQHAGPAAPPPARAAASVVERGDSAGGPKVGGQRILTADTDPSRHLGGKVASYEEQGEAVWCAELAGGSPAACREVYAGPAYVTDVVSLGTDCVGQFLAIVSKSDSPRFVLEGPFRIHGARLLLAPGDVFVVGQKEALPEESSSSRPGSEDPEEIVLEETDLRRQCMVLWRGFRPYFGDQNAGLR